MPPLLAALLLAPPVPVDPGWTSDLLKAVARGKKEHRLVLVDFNATWCGPCQMYRRDVFPTAAFKKAAKNVILVSVDVDRQPGIAQRCGVGSIPDIRLIANGKAVGGLVGYAGPTGLLQELARARKSAKI